MSEVSDAGMFTWVQTSGSSRSRMPARSSGCHQVITSTTDQPGTHARHEYIADATHVEI